MTLCEHLLLSFIIYREVRRRLVPKIVTWTHYDFPELERFFEVMKPTLTKLYPLVDEAQAATGRKLVCHHFQLRFLVFCFLAGFGTFAEALEHVNGSPKWQTILEMPVKTYQASTLSRFLERIGEDRWHQIEARLVRVMLHYRLITLKELLIDEFPILSHLNTQKCLKHFKLDLEAVSRFFDHLDLNTIEALFQTWRYRLYKPTNLLRLFLFDHLWGYALVTHLMNTLQKKPVLQFLLVGLDPLPSYETYRRFVQKVKSESW